MNRTQAGTNLLTTWSPSSNKLRRGTGISLYRRWRRFLMIMKITATVNAMFKSETFLKASTEEEVEIMRIPINLKVNILQIMEVKTFVIATVVLVLVEMQTTEVVEEEEDVQQDLHQDPPMVE
jgi:hypothetical protein